MAYPLIGKCIDHQENKPWDFPGLENYDASNFIDGTAFKSCIANISKKQTLREINTYHKQLMYSADIYTL